MPSVGTRTSVVAIVAMYLSLLVACKADVCVVAGCTADQFRGVAHQDRTIGLVNVPSGIPSFARRCAGHWCVGEDAHLSCCGWRTISRLGFASKASRTTEATGRN